MTVQPEAKETNRIVNPFSPDYVSQITPFRTNKFKRPLLDNPEHDPRQSIAVPDEGKAGRMLKARI